MMDKTLQNKDPLIYERVNTFLQCFFCTSGSVVVSMGRLSTLLLSTLRLLP